LDKPERTSTDLAIKLSQHQLTRRYIDVGSLNLLMMRANPLTPTVLNLALMAQDRGVRVVNDPTGIALTRSKTWLASLMDVPRPRTLVTTDTDAATAFAEKQPHGVVLKPANGSGGRGVQLGRRLDLRRWKRVHRIVENRAKPSHDDAPCLPNRCPSLQRAEPL
jgi:glutathione synthase